MICRMRTTLTLDDDIFVLLQNRIAESGETFRGLVNDLLRTALSRVRDRAPAAKKYETPVFRGGTLLAGDVASTAELLALAEGEDHK